MYMARPMAFADNAQGLTNLVKAALALGTPGTMYGSMNRRQDSNLTIESIKDVPMVFSHHDFTMLIAASMT